MSAGLETNTLVAEGMDPSALGVLDVALNAPIGVEAARNLLLDLAMRGRLLDVTAATRPVEEHEPFSIPASWCWEPLGKLCDFINGDRSKNYPSKQHQVSSGVPFINAGHLTRGSVEFTDMNFISEERFELLRSGKVREGDVLYCLRGSLGKAAVVRGIAKGAIASSLLILRPRSEFLPEYLYQCLTSPLGQRHIRQYDNGTAQPNLSAADVARFLIPVPPAQEQRRIVAKVNQLMALCDELETSQEKKRNVRGRLTNAALAALSSAETAPQFNHAWRRVAENFARLVTTPNDVNLLRDLILDLGIRGRLSSAEKGDESAHTLSRELDALPEQMRRRSSSSSDNPKPPLFDAPSRWVWRPLDQVAEIVGGVTKGRDLRGRQVGSFPYLRVANVQRGSLDLAVMKKIEIPVEELEKYQLKPGDVLFTEGGDWDKVGRSAVWAGEITPCLHQNHVFRARVLLPGLEPRWLSIVGNSPSGRRYFEEAAKQTTNLASINMTQLRAFPMPIPPRQERRRILATVERLLSVCDELETKLRQRDERALRLAEILVASVARRVT